MTIRRCRGCGAGVKYQGRGRPRNRCASWPECSRRDRDRGNAARADDPDFLPSLRLLVERERYSLTDIGMMFGVSTERVRQWCERHNIEHPDKSSERGMSRYRMWDDATNRFRPVSRAAVSELLRQRRTLSREAARMRERETRRAQMVGLLRTLADRLGRSPSLAELAEAMGFDPKQATPYIACRWGGYAGKYPNRYQIVLDELWHAAGLSSRPRYVSYVRRKHAQGAA